ncbi:MAG: helix-turn-helix transcriptional regulator [Chloroflexota bacterium]
MTNRNGGDKGTEGFGAPRDVPRDFLTPWLLLLLRNWNMHGYQLMQMMSISGLAAFDPTTVYRALRRLEEEGLIISGWETGDSGPAKRVYSLTEEGEKFLQTCTSVLKQYQGVLDRFFELYAEAKRTPHPDKPKKPSGSSTVGASK